MNQRSPYRSFVSYIDRSREYYAAQGYSQPYTWTHFPDVPFTPLRKSLSKCRIGLVTTAGLEDTGGTTQGRIREFYTMAVNPTPARLVTDHLFWDKKATHTDDVNSYLPLDRLVEFASERRIGSVSPHFYGVFTDYSQKRTQLRVAPQVLERCIEDGVDAMLLSAL